ncbi:hypothetical protein ColTof3_11391 [Colletotrichum tofieldiae]|nr:hypothetical protein ColTof3_11391 [Colletotrichum tofieldiae]
MAGWACKQPLPRPQRVAGALEGGVRLACRDATQELAVTTSQASGLASRLPAGRKGGLGRETLGGMVPTLASASPTSEAEDFWA